MDYIIGGRDQVGQGWKMLMNCLAAGRSISLPANGVGMSKLCALTTGAYGHVRTQFKMPVGRFEGVEEAIARIGGSTYILDAARVMTAGAIDLGEKPSVISAIVKYHLTERARHVINDAMDVHGGKGICMGPSNYLARAYQQTPIAITVEGANILTRTMIIFGQGAIRGHPWVLKEINATRETDAEKALKDFDTAFFGHVDFVLSNFVRALFLGFTKAIFSPAPGDQHTKRYYQKLTRFAAMFVLGGSLKRRERLSARLGDILSQLYLMSAALKRYEDAGRPADDLPLLHWAMQDALLRMQEAFYGVFDNLPNRFVAFVLKQVIFTWGAECKPPRDRLGQQVVQALFAPGPARERLTAGVFVPKNEDEALGALEAALRAVIAAEAVENKMRAAVKAGTLHGKDAAQVTQAQAAGIISADDARVLERAQTLRRRVIMVDDFPLDLGKSEIFQTTQAVTFEALDRS